MSAISEPPKSEYIGINGPERPRNGGEARTVLEGDLITGTLSSGSIMTHCYELSVPWMDSLDIQLRGSIVDGDSAFGETGYLEL